MINKVNNIILGKNNINYSMDDLGFTLNLKDDVNDIDETVDTRTLLLLFKYMVKKSNIPMDYMNMRYDEVVKLIQREENIDDIINDNE